MLSTRQSWIIIEVELLPSMMGAQIIVNTSKKNFLISKNSPPLIAAHIPSSLVDCADLDTLTVTCTVR